MIRIVVGAGPAGGNRAENQAGAGSETKSQAETTTKPRAGGTAMAARGTTHAPAAGPNRPQEAPPIIVIQALSLDLAAIRRRQEGMTAMTLPWRRDAANPLLKIKSISYLENRHGLRNARRAGADEGIFLNRNGDITEGTFTNLFFIRGDGLVTPPPDAGLLPGITRQTIIELARELDLDCREATVPHAARGDFDGVFLTSSLTEIAPLTILDDIRYAPPRTAAIRQRLLDAYHKLAGQ
jgi:branched-subunit amino acid aminotransferase/4-amino-4-deoxychorismate lyase